MNATNKMLGLAILMAFSTACSDDDKDNMIPVQMHDENKMMTVMHEMMDEMHTMKVTQDPDIDYATMMKMHHMGAVDMAKLEIASGTNSEMKAKAQAIIDAQQKEIGEFDAFLSKATPTTMNMQFHMQMIDGMERMDKQADLQIVNGNIDQDFATLMIEHHKSATEMAQMHLQMSQNEDLKEMSAMIIEEQNKEIADFQNWLLANRGK